jgi:hypothetical protein
MAKMISQAGEMTVQLTEITPDGSNLIMIGQMGVWDSQIVVPPHEILAIMRLMLRPKVILFLVLAPFRALLHWSKRPGAPTN